jgi:hypothetical protein
MIECENAERQEERYIHPKRIMTTITQIRE